MATSALTARAAKAARLFRLVSSPTRVAMLQVIIKRKECPVQQIADDLRMTHSAVSHQLGLLSGADIVVSRKEGRSVLYRMSGKPAAKSLGKLLKSVE